MNKKLIVLIVLSILAVISLIYGITANPKRKAQVARTYTAADGNLQQAPSQAAISTKRRAKRSTFRSWDRNPFTASGTSTSPSGITLGGIMWDENLPKALINDTIVKKGDRIGANTVVEISQDRVVLSDGINNIELKLKE